jgi:hypothetical protein
MLRTAAFLLWVGALLPAQSRMEVTEEKVYNRPAWVLTNGIIRIALLSGGGHIAEVRFTSGEASDINPMRVPHYPTIDPHTYVPERDDAIYGTNPHRWLSAGYMGHLLCFPFYGPPSSPAEERAQLGNHGEAPIVRWQEIERRVEKDAILFRYGADLPKTQYRVERTVRLPQGKSHFTVEEWIENLASYDRAYQWMQHATFGPPFVEPGVTVLDASATRGLTAAGVSSLPPNHEFAWPVLTGAGGETYDLRPMQKKEQAGAYSALLMDPSRRTQFFTLYHPRHRVLVGYTFPAETNPWLADWQENKRNSSPPWNGQVIARGLEFGNSPFAEGLRKAIERGSLFGVPAYSWIGAREKRRTEFTVFLARIGADYPGTADVTVEGGEPKLVPRQ